MTNIFIAIIAYLLDRKFGEYTFIKHPLVVITELITFFEQKFYKNTLKHGLFLVMFVLLIVSLFAISLYLYLNLFTPLIINIIISAFIASMFLSHKDLKGGVIAPIFYLLIFGLPGIIIYKTISTIDARIGANTPKYNKFGKIASALNSGVNFIPFRFTDFVTKILEKQK